MNDTELRLFLNQKLVEIGSVLLAYYKPCHLDGSACLAGDPNPCCINSQFGRGLCPFWMHNKCQFENCDCKLWLCNTAVEASDPVLIEALKHLEHFGKLFGLVRTPLIGERYSGADRQPKERV